MRSLPHAPGDPGFEHLLWSDVVGPGDRRRADVPKDGSETELRRIPADSGKKSRGVSDSRQVGRRQVSGIADRYYKPAAKTYTVRRLQRPRMDIQGRVQKGPQRESAGF